MDKTCNYCQGKGPAYTFMNGETICSGCLAMLGADPRELRQKLFKALNEHARLTSLCANYREALTRIADPLAAIMAEAKAEGYEVNGVMAVSVAKDPEHLKSIAKAALQKEGSRWTTQVNAATVCHWGESV